MKRFSIVKAKLAGHGLNLVPIYGSSALAAWGYDSTTEVFTVVFHSGVIKKYRLQIPVVQQFMAAKSKGGFYNREIKFRKSLRRAGEAATSGVENSPAIFQNSEAPSGLARCLNQNPGSIIPCGGAGAEPEILNRGNHLAKE